MLFGSHSPFFYFESAELKVQEAGLSDAQKRGGSGRQRETADVLGREPL